MNPSPFPAQPGPGRQPGPRLFYVAHRRFPDGSRALRWPQAENRRDCFIITPEGFGIWSRDGEAAVRFEPGTRGHDAIKAAFALYDAGTLPKSPPACPLP